MKKLYYSISEISSLIDEEQHILRYWEKEFPPLCPRKNRAGNRVYSEKELSIVKIIKKLLREDKLSLKGAKDKLEYILAEGIESLPESILPKKEKNIETDKTISNSNVIIGINPSIRKEMLTVLYDIRNYLKST